MGVSSRLFPNRKTGSSPTTTLNFFVNNNNNNNNNGKYTHTHTQTRSSSLAQGLVPSGDTLTSTMHTEKQKNSCDLTFDL